MSEIVKFSDAANLAFHAMIELSEQLDCEVSIKTIAAKLHASEAHLSKVLQRLRKEGLVSSSRGPTGGYQIARPPSKISFEDIFEAIEGPIVLKSCLFGTPVCRNSKCGLGRFVGLVNKEIKNFLGGLTLAEFPEALTRIRKPNLSAA